MRDRSPLIRVLSLVAACPDASRPLFGGVIALVSVASVLHPIPAAAKPVTQFAPLDEPTIETRAATTPRANAASEPPVAAPTGLDAVDYQPVSLRNEGAGGVANEPPSSARTQSLTSLEYDADPSAEDTSEFTHHLAVSFSVARAFASLYEITAEVRLAEWLSIAALAGMGEFETTIPELGENVHLAGREFGGQARLYVVGGFDHGVFLGGEWLRVWAQTAPDDLVQGAGTLTGSGAFVGYKLSAAFGLTFDAKVGVQKLSIVGEGTATGEFSYMGQTQIISASESINEQRTLPLLNVNLGWAI